jgi:hypothetical protein
MPSPIASIKHRVKRPLLSGLHYTRPMIVDSRDSDIVTPHRSPCKGYAGDATNSTPLDASQPLAHRIDMTSNSQGESIAAEFFCDNPHCALHVPFMPGRQWAELADGRLYSRSEVNGRMLCDACRADIAQPVVLRRPGEQ